MFCNHYLFSLGSVYGSLEPVGMYTRGSLSVKIGVIVFFVIFSAVQLHSRVITVERFLFPCFYLKSINLGH